ncbi:hypothetical protein Ae201684P_000699 [Aphanomyces euteiches]|uniref:Uncharacterized protein n=1 Tax=Aphanomyces euteiches TaxID=100861 RepID=A0A6G0XR30_9STRA|nr:hypothetical protein Ae201684_002064 [Aphanomyces euteiches]KAH9087288.1 hypothetical protein Ae201684P_000699 [Aphanomyces euteiches]
MVEIDLMKKAEVLKMLDENIPYKDIGAIAECEWQNVKKLGNHLTEPSRRIASLLEVTSPSIEELFLNNLVGDHTATRLQAEHSLALAAHLDGLGFFSLGHVFLLFGKDQLNVSRVGHVRSNTTVSTVSAAALLNGHVGLRVGNVQLFDIQTLQFSVGFRVLDQVQDDAGSLLRPSALVAGGVQLLTLGMATRATSVLGERHSGLHFQDIVQELLGLSQRVTLDRVAHFTAVLVVHTQVTATGLGRTGLIFGFLAVGRHLTIAMISCD